MSLILWIEVFSAINAIVIGYTLLFLKNYFNTNKKGRKEPVSTMIVFGSGGHTTEMVRLVKNLPKTRYSPRNYVVADNDDMSKEKMSQIENNATDAKLIEIPRSRKVHQSFFTSIFTTLNAMVYCFIYNYKHQPELIICNGPGTCIPVCYSALVLSWLMPWRKNGFGHLKIIYVESLARVKSLSLTGKLLLPTASRFILQWPELYTKITGVEIKENGKLVSTHHPTTPEQTKSMTQRIIYKNDLM
ncbi:Alg14-domain-containing protein [Piromyces finnis]|uniref:UDP-N-acetylglucosamine transferase subunit ALG14 n=1 Tax=Piromyces finnis TaxID=1754191 RepID=A0A1Y1VBB9_9FUNG|nr:Alg14-domain-containing protein [Piromyces finnis]|eukprot:ORX51860.1 Alg14-domain-containing protein [Piromyces finnis]